MLVYDEKVPRIFWRSSTALGVLPSREAERRGAIVEIAKINAMLKHSMNKLCTIKIAYHGTNQTDKAREQI